MAFDMTATMAAGQEVAKTTALTRSETLTTLTDELHSVLSQLEDRLSPVLRSAGPEDPTAPVGPTPLSSALADSIQNSNDRLTYALTRIRLMTDRVDL